MFNDKPNSDQEWRFFEFYLTYVSSDGGPSDQLKASDVIYSDTFYTSSGASVRGRKAAVGHQYKGYDVLDVTLYPGASGKAVIGILIPKDAGDLLLNVPINKGKDVVWVDLSGAAGSPSPSGNGQNAAGTSSGAERLVSYIENHGKYNKGCQYIQDTEYYSSGVSGLVQ